MTKARNLADLLDGNGDVKASGLDNVPPSNDASALTTGTLNAARLPSEIVSSDTTPQLGGNLASNGNNILFADNNKAIFGAGSDLQIYSTGTGDTVIAESGVGSLKLLADDFYIRNAADTQRMVRCIDGGLVGLYYAGSEKLATTSTGIDVTGTVAATAFTGDGSGLTGVNPITASSYSTNGYVKFSDGLIIQWGLSPSNSTGLNTVSFPISFPNACLSVQGLIRKDGDTNGIGAYWTMSGAPSTTSFVHAVHDAALSFYWMAMGY